MVSPSFPSDTHEELQAAIVPRIQATHKAEISLRPATGAFNAVSQTSNSALARFLRNIFKCLPQFRGPSNVGPTASVFLSLHNRKLAGTAGQHMRRTP